MEATKGFARCRASSYGLRCWTLLLIELLLIGLAIPHADGFSTSSLGGISITQQQQQEEVFAKTSLKWRTQLATNYRTTHLRMGYVSPEEQQRLDEMENGGGGSTNGSERASATKTKPPLVPKIGDIVRYYDLDGGDERGQELVGRITFLTKVTGAPCVAELTQLEDVGDGYYVEFGSTKRAFAKKDRDVTEISPLVATFVRSEQAFKIPFDASTGRVRVRQETYDLDDWDGPQSVLENINQDVVEADGIIYNDLKKEILKNTALVGLAGTALVSILKGTEDAAIFFGGVLASLGYLFFLSVKTDTLASPGRKMGSKLSGLRFVFPPILLVAIALYNKSLGDANPLADSTNPFDSVTSEQFGAAVLGFLLYRGPLVLGQIREALMESEDDASSLLPGSAGVALQLAQGSGSGNASEDTADESLVPVLLVSGPQATGREELVKMLLESDDRFVAPSLVDRMSDGVTFERLSGRGEFLEVDDAGRFGLTRDGILDAARPPTEISSEEELSPRAVVVNASVGLAKKLRSSLSGARLIGVWVGLDSVTEFERRLTRQIDEGSIIIPEDETRESILRARIKEIVNEIDFGLSSGIFEFTILNSDSSKSLKELKEAAGYCFK